MSPGPIIPTFDPGEDRRASCISGAEVISIQHFTFQTGEEAFGHRVVETIADAAHGRPHTELCAASPEGDRGVFGALSE